MSVLATMRKGQRLDVKALRNLVRIGASGKVRGIIKAKSTCQLYKYFDNFNLGRDNNGSYTTYVETAIEGIDFELINGRVPFPD